MTESARQRKRQVAKTGVTIKMVAREAGVSTATVSRVLSHAGSVTSDLEERVRRAVETLGYQPNAAARGLSIGSLRNIGIIMPDMTNPYFFHVVDQITREQQKRATEYCWPAPMAIPPASCKPRRISGPRSTAWSYSLHA